MADYFALAPAIPTPVAGGNQKEESLEQPPSRDLHVLPLDRSGHSSPTLYLPPLLSPLPEHISLQQPTHPLASPFVTEARLPDIDPASLSLHRALHHFKPLTPSYASVPYSAAFNWSELVLPEGDEREWYCVVFRSKKQQGRDDVSLYDADKLAHDEAIRNGGLILYWYGTPDEVTGMNLATCIWQSRKHAAAAHSGPHHINAMRLSAGAYEVYNLERYRLRKRRGGVGVTIEEFEGGEVGW